MPLNARRHIRKMRGGAQSHLVEASDGNFYVVKFQNNPQHRRILVNELISAVLLRYLEVECPAVEVIEVKRDFLEENPEIQIVLGSRTIAVEPGWHFGSRFPGDPALLPVYDFVPDALLERVENLDDFLKVLLFDKWVSNADARQCVFYRRQTKGWRPPRAAFVGSMIDHGFAFQGPNWEFVDAPLQGLYPRRKVYEGVQSLEDFQPWLSRIEEFPDEIIDEAWKRVPPAWIEGEEDELEQVLERLHRRRKRVGELIQDSFRAFPGTSR